MSAKPVPVENLSFEAALAELDSIVKSLETGSTALEDSISAYERGIALQKHCERRLGEARSRIEKITVGKDGTITTAPFDEGE